MTPEEIEAAKELMQDTITDMVRDLLDYDRREDEALTLDTVNELRQNGTFSQEFLLECFKKALEEHGQGMAE
jgi:hypothetical protein